jgi:uncharacterized protein YggU (UPF0235/DUF167 family)
LGGNPRGGRKQGEAVCILWVRVKPKSRTDAVLGWGREGFLEMQVRAVPERGEANRSCCRQLARLLDVPASCVSIEKGQSSVRKKFRVEGLAQREGERILARTLGPKGPG